MRFRRYTIRSLLIFTALAAMAFAALKSDSLFTKRVWMYQRAAHAFDAGGGYVISESAIVFEGVHTWLPRQKKIYAVLLGEAGMGVHNVANAQLDVLTRSQGDFTIEKTAEGPSIVWVNDGETRTIALQEGNVFDSAKHRRWDRLFTEDRRMVAKSGKRLPLTSSGWTAYIADKSIGQWTSDTLEAYLKGK